MTERKRRGFWDFCTEEPLAVIIIACLIFGVFGAENAVVEE